MPAGKRRHLLTIEEKTVTGRDGMGGEVTTWATFSTWWADALPIRGNEYVTLRAAQSDLTTRFVGLYMTGVTTAMRVQWGGSPYEIVEAINVKGRGRELELLCRGPAQAMV